jgi:hypothetical protein
MSDSAVTSTLRCITADAVRPIWWTVRSVTDSNVLNSPVNPMLSMLRWRRAPLGASHVYDTNKLFV